MRKCAKISITYSDFRNFDRNPNNSSPELNKTKNANVPNENSFQGLLKTCNLSPLSIAETEKNALKRPKPLSLSYTGNTEKSGCTFVSSFEILLLETAVIATVWLMIQLEDFPTSLLATVLQLIEQFDQCLNKQRKDS